MKEIKNKVLIIGLPKSGTSTVATMFRILGYKVTGPNTFHKKEELTDTIKKNDVFQDYPWCFEYRYLLKENKMKVIVLKRNSKEWTKSFIKNYGFDNDNYLSFSYINLLKSSPETDFEKYHKKFYSECEAFLKSNNIQYLSLNLTDLNWTKICRYVNKPIPKTLFGITSKVPKVNSNNKNKRGKRKNLIKKVKKILAYTLGSNYVKFTSFLYKNFS